MQHPPPAPKEARKGAPKCKTFYFKNQMAFVIKLKSKGIDQCWKNKIFYLLNTIWKNGICYLLNKIY